MTTSEKVTISLPPPLVAFVESYQAAHKLSRSEVIQRALSAFQAAELAQAYRDAAAELLADPLTDADPSHGLTPSTEETW